MAKYKDDVIMYIEDDVKKIQTKPGMYISYLGSKGAMHIFKEAVNNMIDECANWKSPGNKVNIIFSKEDNTIFVSDNGRGIPVDKVEIICTKLQSGSKFTRDSSTKDVNKKVFSAGENGVGLTAINALSSKFEVQTRWDKVIGTFKFENGVLVSKEIVKNPKPKQTGTSFKFTPNEDILGKCNYKFAEIEDWVNKTSYLVDPNISIYLSKGTKDLLENTTMYHHENDMLDLINDETRDGFIVEPIRVSFVGYYNKSEDKVNIYDARNKSESDPEYKKICNTWEPIKVYASFAYTNKEDEALTYSFCDYIETVDHGVHVNAAKSAWCRGIMKIARETMTENELKKYTPNFDDAKAQLVCALNIFCDNPQFASQTKEKISNEELFVPISSIIYTELMKEFKKDPKLVKKIVTWVKTCAKSRLEVTKIRKSDYSAMDRLSESVLKGFEPAYSNKYKEIYLSEGDSAKGGIMNARDARTQAVFALRGVPLNSFDSKINDVLKNQEFKSLIKILGCGIGPSFDLSRLKYDKIIIFTDSDIDGFKIASILSVFFVTQMPEIVKAGKLYKAVAPLYLVDDKKHPYILSKTEYYDLYANNIVSHISLLDDKGDTIPSKEFKKIIVDNFYYINYLRYLVKFYYTNPSIIEIVIRYMDNEKELSKQLKKRFKEIKYEKGIVSGVYNDNYQYLVIDEKFKYRARNLINLIFNKNDGKIDYKFLNKDEGVTYSMTMGEMLFYCEKYRSRVIERIKGLGELPAEVLWKTVLDPSKRELIKLTMEDLNATIETFKILHGKNNSGARRDLMQGYTLNREDIDN